MGAGTWVHLTELQGTSDKKRLGTTGLNVASFMAESLKWVTDLVPCHWEKIHAVNVICTLQWDIVIAVCLGFCQTLGCVMHQQQLR